MYDYLQVVMLVNLLVTVFYSAYAINSSLISGDKLKSLLGVLLVALFGVLMVTYHVYMEHKK